MTQQRIREGTAKELAPYLAQHPDQRFRLIAISPEEAEPTATPNEEIFTMLREIATMKAKMKPTDGEETDRLLEEARAGAMYGDHSNP
ncbi:MAG TPA: hypothetical protein VFA07_13480 [Chthonomonadaceae bacterium]|nr:hypothetical protein [Chthonomonadaceae bacterium]